MINWGEVADILRELVSGKRGYLTTEGVLDEIMLEILKKKYPNNYRKVIKENKDKLLKIRAQLTEKFFCEIKEEVLKIIGPYN